MVAERAALVRTWKVGRYTATLTVPQLADGTVHAVLEWAPEPPTDLSPQELEAYRSGRNAALSELGLTVLVLE